ncbi:MAG: DNA repair protein RadC [Clostridia bacterium]|nr:MAG: DNA repair protein RadC [Clostridia bacterium]
MARQLALFEKAGSYAQTKEKVYRVQVVRLQMVREASLATYVRTIGTPADVADLVRPLLEGADREHFLVLCLDTKNRVSAIHTVSVGTLNSSPVHPREVFKAAILANAASVILAHNHPSGDPEPSRDDREVTARLVECGKILGIGLLDHVVLGEGRFYSLKEAGLL